MAQALLCRGRASQKWGFEYRQNNNDCYTFRTFSRIPLIVKKIKELPFGDPPTGKEVSVNNLMEEMKPIIVEKRESDFRDVSNLI